MGTGLGSVVFVLYLLYALIMLPFCVLVGSRTSQRMGWMMSVPLLFLPLALLIALFIP